MPERHDLIAVNPHAVQQAEEAVLRMAAACRIGPGNMAVSGAIIIHSTSLIVRSRPGSTMVPFGNFCTAAISPAVAGIEPVDPAMMIGPVTLPAAMRCVSASRMALRWRAGDDCLSSSSRCGPVGAGDLEEFERQLPPQRMVGGIEFVERLPIQLLCLHRVDDLGEIAGEPDCVGGACRRDQRAFRVHIDARPSAAGCARRG